MTAADLIHQARADGVALILTPTGTIKASGDQDAGSRWVPTIRENKAGIVGAPKVGADGTATASRWWLIHYPDRDPVEVACCPEATHADILERHPDAEAAEPFEPTSRQPSAPITASEESTIRAWLALIGETDPATIADVIERCRDDLSTRAYFLGRSGEGTS